MSDITEGATPGAHIPQNHESGRPFREALREVWARSFLADAVKFIFPEDSFDVLYRPAIANACPDPGGLVD